MADLDDIYHTRILELAAEMPRTERLKAPDATASAHSKLCGSTIDVDVKMQDGRVVDYGQTVKACLLGQAAASVVGREIVGTGIEEFSSVAEAMRRMLKENGPPPSGRWSDLSVLEPVRDYKARHASTLLVFEALSRAMEEASGNKASSVEPQATEKT